MPELTTVTTLINLLALAASLWLGFYILTRSPYGAISRLAALMLWSFDTYFLSNTLWNSLQSSVLLAWLLQGTLLALPLMLHLTVRLLPAGGGVPAPLVAFNRAGVPLAYAAALVLMACGVLPSRPPVGLFNYSPDTIPESVPFGFVSKTASPLYPLFLGFLLLVSVLALLNLWNGRLQTRGTPLARPFTTFFAATALTGTGAVYSGFGTWLRLDLPTFPADVFFGVSIFLVGYAVARYAALLEGRPIDRDFMYALLLVGSFTAVYVLIVFVFYLAGQVSFVALVLTVIGTIAATSMIEGARISLDHIFYQGQFQRLRSNLRALAREAGTGGTLSDRLQAVLAALCRVFRIQKGFIAVGQDNRWIVQATYEANPLGQFFECSALSATESIGMLPSGNKDLPGMTLLVPLFAGGRQVGALVLGARESRQDYQEADLDLLEDLAGQISGLIHAVWLQEENARIIDRMVAEFREKEHALQLQMQELAAHGSSRPPATGGTGEEMLVPLVEDALRKFHDVAYLGEHPLAKLRVVDRRLHARTDSAGGFIDRGKAVAQVLEQALSQLRPDSPPPGKNAVPPREWHSYIILHDSYVLDEPNRDIMSRLYISEGTFNRTRRRALHSVAKALAEMEQAAAS